MWKASELIAMAFQVNLGYREISNIRHTESENLSDCRLVLQLPLANPLKPGVKLRTKM